MTARAALSGKSQTDKGTVSGAENKFLSGRERERELARESRLLLHVRRPLAQVFNFLKFLHIP